VSSNSVTIAHLSLFLFLSLQVFVHPIAPVLNETRALVKQFNLIYKKKVEMVKGETFSITIDSFLRALHRKMI
jgi:hypothetical protein